MRTLKIAAAENEGRLDVAAVLEESLRQQGHRSDESALLSGLQTHQRQLIAHELGDLIRIRSRSGTAAVYIRRNVMDLHGFFIYNERLRGSPLIGGDNHSVLVYQSHDGGSRLHKRRPHLESLLEQLIPISLAIRPDIGVP